MKTGRQTSNYDSVALGLSYKGTRRRKGGHPSGPATVDLRRKADVRSPNLSPALKRIFFAYGARELPFSLETLYLWSYLIVKTFLTMVFEYRADDKTASEYNLEGGATLHLVLALRGGSF